MKVAIIRGSYLNKYEMQNYQPLVDKYEITAFSGLNPIHQKFPFAVEKLFSPVDLPDFPYKMPFLNRLFLGDAMCLFGLQKRLKEFDIVHTRETYFHFTNQVLKAKKKGFVKKVVCTCSETIPFNHETIWNKKNLKRYAIENIDLFHCLTQKAKKCLIKEGCKPEKIVVFPYGVDLNKFKPDATGNKNLNVQILFVGRLVWEKGVFDLLKAFEKTVKEVDNIELTMIGSGKEKDKIINLINQRGLLNKVVIKKVPYSSISSEYQKADIFCLLSKRTKHWEEYLGMALIEAMASGLPVISTLSGAVPEVVGPAGFLVEEGDWEKAGDRMIELFKDPFLRKELGRKARLRADNFFNKDKVAQKIASLWNRFKI